MFRPTRTAFLKITHNSGKDELGLLEVLSLKRLGVDLAVPKCEKLGSNMMAKITQNDACSLKLGEYSSTGSPFAPKIKSSSSQGPGQPG